MSKSRARKKTAKNALYFMPKCREFRIHAGLSISELAHKAGVSRDLIYKVEDGVAVRSEKLHLIARVLEEQSKRPFRRDTEITKLSN